MTKKQYLGIHLSKKEINAVTITKAGAETRPEEAWKITTSAETLRESVADLLKQLREKLDEHFEKMPKTVLALGGQFYQTQPHHSEFHEDKQIQQTLGFDIEEELALDSESLALCYEPIPGKGPGRDLLVYVAKRSELQYVLAEFESAQLDALAAEPDVVAWTHYLKAKEDLPAETPVAVVGWAAEIVYVLFLDKNHDPLLTRSCLCPNYTEAGALLALELNRSMALLPQEQKPRAVLYHQAGLTDSQIARLSQQTNLECRELVEKNLAQAFAAGAALGWSQGRVATDFRHGDLEPKSHAVARRRAWYGLSGAVTLLAVILIIVMGAHARDYRRAHDQAVEQMTQAWQQAKPGEQLPRQIARIPRALRRQLEQMQTVDLDQPTKILGQSASNVLLLMLEILNGFPENSSLDIDSLRVTAKTVSLSGSVADLTELEILAEVTRNHRLLQLENWESDKIGRGADGRRRFSMSLTLAPTAVKAD